MRRNQELSIGKGGKGDEPKVSLALLFGSLICGLNVASAVIMLAIAG